MPQRGSAACLAHPTPGTRPGASACSCIIPCCICIKACITLGLVMACWKSGFCICLNANESQVFLISELVVIKGTHCLCLRHKEFWSGLENWNRNHDDLSYSLPTPFTYSNHGNYFYCLWGFWKYININDSVSVFLHN